MYKSKKMERIAVRGKTQTQIYQSRAKERRIASGFNSDEDSDSNSDKKISKLMKNGVSVANNALMFGENPNMPASTSGKSSKPLQSQFRKPDSASCSMITKKTPLQLPPTRTKPTQTSQPDESDESELTSQEEYESERDIRMTSSRQKSKAKARAKAKVSESTLDSSSESATESEDSDKKRGKASKMGTRVSRNGKGKGKADGRGHEGEPMVKQKQSLKIPPPTKISKSSDTTGDVTKENVQAKGKGKGKGKEKEKGKAREKTGLNLPKRADKGQQQHVDMGMAKELEEQLEAFTVDNSSQQTKSAERKTVPKRAEELKTCPFCDGEMPGSSSDELLAMMQVWLDKFHSSRPPRPTDTLTACARHRDELSIIPQGIKRGWPQSLDFKALRDEILDPGQPFLQRMCSRIQNPRSSSWYQDILETRARLGRKALGSGMTVESMEEEQAGYYGEQGYECFASVLQAYFIHSPPHPALDLTDRTVAKTLEPLSAFQFVSRVLAPELVVMLIEQHSKVDTEQAKKIKSESARYGVAMFPSDKSGSLSNLRGNELWEKDEEELAERNRTQKEKKEKRDKMEKSTSLKRQRNKPGGQKGRSSSEGNVQMRMISDEDSDEEEQEVYNPVASQSRRKVPTPVHSQVQSEKTRGSTPRKRRASPLPVDISSTPDASTSSIQKRPRPKPKARNVSSAAVNQNGASDLEMSLSQSQDTMMDSLVAQDKDVEMSNSQTQGDTSVVDLTVSSQGSAISGSCMPSTLDAGGTQRSHIIWPTPLTQETLSQPAPRTLSQDSMPLTQGSPGFQITGGAEKQGDRSRFVSQDSYKADDSTASQFRGAFTQLGTTDRERTEMDQGENGDESFVGIGVASRPFDLARGSLDAGESKKRENSNVHRRTKRSRPLNEHVSSDSSQDMIPDPNSDSDSDDRSDRGKKGKGKDFNRTDRSSPKKGSHYSAHADERPSNGILNYFARVETKPEKRETEAVTSHSPHPTLSIRNDEDDDEEVNEVDRENITTIPTPVPSGRVSASSSSPSRGFSGLKVSKSPPPSPKIKNFNEPPASPAFTLEV